MNHHTNTTNNNSSNSNDDSSNNSINITANESGGGGGGGGGSVSWSRTPGKPGVGGSSMQPVNRWPVVTRSTPTPSMDSSNDEPVDNDGNTITNNRTEDSRRSSNTDQFSWPPPILDSSLPVNPGNPFAVPNPIASGTNEWSASEFAESLGSSLLCNPSAGGGARDNDSSVWSNNSGATAIACGSCAIPLPRPITGQHQTTPVPSASNPPYSVTSELSNRWNSGVVGNSSGSCANWSPSADPDMLLGDDQVDLSLALSKLNMSRMNQAQTVNNEFQSGTEVRPEALTVACVTSESLADSDSCFAPKVQKKSSADSVEAETVFTEADDIFKSVINTTAPWGVNPVDQSTPWDTTELTTDDPLLGSPCASVDPCPDYGLLDTVDLSSQSCSTRSINPSLASRDVESNVWPSEPPNGCGIWETHYECLGERTARWQQNSNVNIDSTSSTNTGYMSRPLSAASGPRSQFNQSQSGTDGTNVFRVFNRPGLFPLPGSSVIPGSASTPRPVLGNPQHLVSMTGGSSGSRGMQLNNAVNLAPGSQWSLNAGQVPSDPNSAIGNRSRWPNNNNNNYTNNYNNYGRKQQHHNQHVPPQVLSNQGGSNLRWTSMGNVPGGNWSFNDPRRPGLLQSNNWNSSPTGEQVPSGFSSQQQIPGHLRGIQQSNSSILSDFQTSIFPGQRGNAGLNNQSFRPPPSHHPHQHHPNAFFPGPFNPPSTSNTMGSASSSSSRMFLNPQQQLQQRSILQANVIRQLIQLGLPEEEVQHIFSDSNTNLERSLIELRDRTCLPGLEELINSFSTSSTQPRISNLDESIPTDLGRSESRMVSGPRPISARTNTGIGDQSPLPRSNFMPLDDFDGQHRNSQQRETQLLQTIMQLQSRQQELNQRIMQSRSANWPFHVVTQLKTQLSQVNEQIEGYQTQLRQLRGQTGVLKLMGASVSSSSTQAPIHDHHHAPPPLFHPNQSHHSMHRFQQQQHLNQLNSSSTGNNYRPMSSPWSSISSAMPPPSTSAVHGSVGMHRQFQHQYPQNMGDLVGGSLDSAFDSSMNDQQRSNLGSGSFMWEAGPWSGPSLGRTSTDPHSLASNTPIAASGLPGDRRWSTTAMPPGSRVPFDMPSASHPPMTDHHWSDPQGYGSDIMSNAGSSSFTSDARRTVDLEDTRMSQLQTNEAVGFTRAVASKSWLLVHNIPAHMTVGVLKTVISTALANNRSRMDNDDSSDFECHPNMSSRWILVGFNNSFDCHTAYNFLSGSGPGQNNNFFVSARILNSDDALRHLQEIQFLASRIRGLNYTGMDSTGLRTDPQTSLANSSTNFTGPSGDLCPGPSTAGLQSNAAIDVSNTSGKTMKKHDSATNMHDMHTN